MRCSKAGTYLSPYIDGELDAKEITLLELHLAQCAQCQCKLGELQLLRNIFSQSESFSAPSSFRAAVMERLDTEPAKGFSLIPVFIRFAEALAVVLAITVGVMSGGTLIYAFVPNPKGEQVIASLSLETFEALPPDSLGRAYLTMTEVRR